MWGEEIMENKIETPKCHKKPMELKAVCYVAHTFYKDGQFNHYFQCNKCGKVIFI